MAEKAIQVRGLGKQYQIGVRERGYTTFRESVANALSAPFRRLRNLSGTPEEGTSFWALEDVSFDVEPGKVVGIIGRNGAGKSTLLKVLSQITEPTTGEINLNGRVASLLEVGTGFHPELTGRENIYLNGSILGMSRAEIKKKFDEIVAFSEVEKFLDTPVKRFSSGMYVRLAFAVAAHLEPEILIVDEVLAVGDVQFQKKCLGKMGAVAKGGRTVLFVSHNMGAVSSLCSTCVLLDDGRILKSGQVAAIVSAYMKWGDAANSTRIPVHKHIRGSQAVSIVSATLANADGIRTNALTIRESSSLTLEYEVSSPTEGAFFLLVSSADGTQLMSSFQYDNHPPMRFTGNGSVTATIKDTGLLPGTYNLSVGILDKYNGFIDWAENVARIEILPQFCDGKPYDHRLGYFTRLLQWK